MPASTKRLLHTSGLLLHLLVISFLQSCTEKTDPLSKVWIYKEEQSKEEIIENTSVYDGKKDLNLTPANFIDLQEDGTYSSYLKDFEHGKWFFKDQNLVLANRKKEILELLVKKSNAKELVCQNKMKRTIYRFEGHPNRFESPADNPFSPENNRWRIKPAQRESDAELRTRLKNHFRFWEKYFAWGLKDKIGYLDVRSTPSLLKMYGNGFQLEYYENLFPEWKAGFYDTADCRRAYENLYYKMYAKNIKWPDTKNRFERFVSAFRQLQQWMDEDMSPYLKPRKDQDAK